jgi:3-deoxy-manno-octulosonate cytidylyltransferase (CMP-KDO synthetase)
MRFVGVIPARFSSTRLPGKPLLSIAGKPLIQWVYESASRSRRLERLVVATDDERIECAVKTFGGEVVLTRSDHLSGTDRVAEVAAGIDAEVFINVQGDEPLIAAATIDAVCTPFLEDRELQISTARIRIAEWAEAQSPHVVKVVTDDAGRALYFSRSPVPYPRRTPARFFKHIGIYGYRRSFLLALSTLRPSTLERTEALEQLRFLENGHRIQVVEVRDDSLGVDTPEDLERVKLLLEHQTGTNKSVAD